MDEYIKILGIRFATLSLMGTIKLIERKIEEKAAKVFHVITANPEIVLKIEEDDEFKRISLEADLITADGVGIILAAKLKGKPLPERVTGYDMLVELLKIGNAKGWSFYLLGAEEWVNKKVSEHVKESYPGVRIAGRHNGFFNEQEELKIIKEIEDNEPDILIVALGAPLAEKWIHRNKNRLNTKVAIGVGGSFDIISGKLKRAPLIWQKLNLEWLYRLIAEPSRRKRQKAIPVFVWKVLMEAVKKA